MHRPALACFALLAVLFASPTLAEPSPHFVVGQRWSLADPDYPSVSLTIGRLEILNGQSIVHISLHSVPLPNGEKIEIAHMPFAEASLQTSIDSVQKTGDAPNSEFEAGYADWKGHRGGYYTITVPEAISVVVRSLFGGP